MNLHCKGFSIQETTVCILVKCRCLLRYFVQKHISNLFPKPNHVIIVLNLSKHHLCSLAKVKQTELDFVRQALNR